MPNALTSPLTRRGLLAAGGATALGVALAACGNSDAKDAEEGTTNEAGGKKSGPWSFKDDRGITAKADHTPQRIVAFTGTAAALHDYGVEVVGVFGPTKTKDGKPDVQAGDLDVNKVEIIGNTYGEFNVEKYAAFDPELLVSAQWIKNQLWYVPDQSKDKILQLAPSVALWAAETTMPKAIERHAELAASLGADLKSPKVTAAKARFEKAAARLRAAAKAKPEIRVLIGSASQDLFYVSLAKTSADTLYFQQFGVRFIQPDHVDAQGFFENLSWENVGKYKADIIMMDNRSSAIQPSALGSKPTWQDLPAVKAGQVIPRTSEPIFSYDKCAPILDALAQAIERAKKVS
jgi:iron complex transport system substrate-binding protein